MERRPDVAPHPAGERDPDGFEVLWAAEPGPLPEDVNRDLRSTCEEVSAVVEGNEGVVGVRYGRRVVVAPVGSPDDAVDVADVDVPRSLVLTMGAKDPTPAGALLAQVLSFRTDVLYGYASAPDIDGPSMSVLQQLMPALGRGTVTQIDEVGTIALGRTPEEVRGGIESASADEGEDDEDDPYQRIDDDASDLMHEQ